MATKASERANPYSPLRGIPMETLVADFNAETVAFDTAVRKMLALSNLIRLKCEYEFLPSVELKWPDKSSEDYAFNIKARKRAAIRSMGDE